MKKSLLISALALSILASTSAYAEREPRPIVSDKRIRQIAYTPNEVVHIRGSYGFVTTIEFGANENLQGVFLGDTIAWQIAPTPPRGNRLFIKPVEPDATTNMTVITDRGTYLFHLSDAKNPTDITYVVRFLYPQYSPISGQDRPRSGAAGKRNSAYSVAGEIEAKMGIRLNNVSDDGQFTYFRFEPDSEIPRIYLVGADGTENTVNYRREGDAIVVEKTGNNFTLRNGTLYLCVRNDSRIAAEEKRIAKMQKSQKNEVTP